MRAAGKERSAPQTEGARYAAAIFSIALVYEGRQAPVSERKRWRRRKRSVRDAESDGRSRTKAWCGSRRQEPDKGLVRQCVCIYTKFLRSDIQKAAVPGRLSAFSARNSGQIVHMQIYLPVIYKISRNRVYTRHIFLHMENEQVLQAVWRADPAVSRRNWIRSGNYFLYVNFGWASAGPEFRGTREAPQGTMNIE